MTAKKKTTKKKAATKRGSKKDVAEFKNVPPVDLSFNEHGLRNSVNYEFKENGMVDWRKMIDPQYVYLNRERFLKKDSPVDIESLSKEDIEALKKKARDEDLIIKLQGYKELAELRGYTDVRYEIVLSDPSYVCANCHIEWRPNYEAGSLDRMLSETGSADAHEGNCPSIFGANYLTAVATNRAFGRAVRNFLKIDIVTQDEIAFEKPQELETSYSTGPASMIADKLKKLDMSFGDFKKRLEKSDTEYVGMETWETPNDIPTGVLTLAMIELNKIND